MRTQIDDDNGDESNNEGNGEGGGVYKVVGVRQSRRVVAKSSEKDSGANEH